MSERKFWMRWRVRLGYPVAVVFWLLAAPTPRAILFGGIIAMFGLIVRGAAAGYLRKDEELSTSGLYASTRNPLYLGSSFLAAGFIIAGNSLWAGLLVAVYFSAFYYAVMRNEEADLRARFGSAFEKYAARVPLFFPHFFGAHPPPESATPEKPAKQFSWSQYRRNREYKALVGTIAALGMMALRMWLRGNYGH